MEGAREQESGLVHQILPPPLEDAGLENCALPPESIKEAFLRAATAVKSRATPVFVSDDEDDNGCVNGSFPTAVEGHDTLLGLSPENDSPGACAIEKGGRIRMHERGKGDVDGRGGVGVGEGEDKVVVGGDGRDEGGKACVDELYGLDIGDDVKSNGGDEEEKQKQGKRPTLVEDLA